MRYSEVLDTVKADGGAWTADIPDSWGQGRTVFGGLLAALLVRAMRGLVQQSAPLRVLQTTFVAPVAPGRVRIEAQVLRTGKSATHAEARITVDGQVGCLAVAVFGLARSSAIDIHPAVPTVPSSQDSREFRYVEGLTPAFTRHCEMRWASGKMPFRGATEPKTQIYVGFRDEPFAGAGALGEAQLIGYADIIPSPAISLLTKPAMASSLTWTLELLTDDYGAQREGLWLMDAEVSAGRDGYLSQTATLWSPQWQAVALSRQSVVAFG